MRLALCTTYMEPNLLGYISIVGLGYTTDLGV